MEIIAFYKGKEVLAEISDLGSGFYVKVFDIVDYEEYINSTKAPSWNPGTKKVEELKFADEDEFKQNFTEIEDMRNFYAYGRTLRKSTIIHPFIEVEINKTEHNANDGEVWSLCLPGEGYQAHNKGKTNKGTITRQLVIPEFIKSTSAYFFAANYSPALMAKANEIWPETFTL